MDPKKIQAARAFLGDANVSDDDIAKAIEGGSFTFDREGNATAVSPEVFDAQRRAKGAVEANPTGNPELVARTELVGTAKPTQEPSELATRVNTIEQTSAGISPDEQRRNAASLGQQPAEETLPQATGQDILTPRLFQADVQPELRQTGTVTSSKLSQQQALEAEMRTRQLEADFEKVAQEVAELELDDDALRQNEQLLKTLSPERYTELLKETLPEVRRKAAEVDSQINDIINREPNPLRLFKNGGGMAAALAVAATGFNQSLLGDTGPNEALGFIQAALNADIQAQTADKAADLRGASSRKALLDTIRGTVQDEVSVTNMVTSAATAALARAQAPIAAGKTRLENAESATEMGKTLLKARTDAQANGRKTVVSKIFNRGIRGGVERRVQEGRAAAQASTGIDAASKKVAKPTIGEVAAPAVVQRALAEGFSQREAQQFAAIEKDLRAGGAKIQIKSPGLYNQMKGQFGTLKGKKMDRVEMATRDANDAMRALRGQREIVRLVTQAFKLLPGGERIKLGPNGELDSALLSTLGKDGEKAAALLRKANTKVKQFVSPVLVGTAKESLGRMSKEDMFIKMSSIGGPAAEGEGGSRLVSAADMKGWAEAVEEDMREADNAIRLDLGTVGLDLESTLSETASTIAAKRKGTKSSR